MIIRIANTPNNFGQKGYMSFENVTMVRLGLCILNVTDADMRKVPDAQKLDRH